MNKEVLYDFVFNFNPYTQKWNAVKRENYNELFNGDKGNVISSSSISTLEELIVKTAGDREKIEKLVK